MSFGQTTIKKGRVTMKRIEQWVVSLLFLHFVLLIAFQWVMIYTDMSIYFHPVYEYFGVYKEENPKILETIDQFLNNVIKF